MDAPCRFFCALRSSLSVIALFSVLANPVSAQQTCSPATPSDGDTITCSGTGIGIVDGGLDDATITVETGAVITGTNQAFRFDDDTTFTNFGTLTGQNDHGVQGDNDNTVINRGTITGLDGDGVNIDNDGLVENYGIIRGADDGVQLEDDATVINHATGEIYADDEGVNINTDNATLTNAGLIEAGDDAVNAARGATITNSGIIRSVGGDQDAVDLDSGTVVNSGTIMAIGTQDGIDFDPSGDSSSVTNSGLIEGNVGINVDPADTGAQTIVNSGTITGRGGVAMDLGAGDDTLEIAGGTINGTVELGAGTDTLVVSRAGTGLVTFTSDPEVLDIRVNSALFDAGRLLSIDPALIGAADLLGAQLGYNLGHQALGATGQAGSWASGSLTVGQSQRDGQVAIGRDFDDYGLFGMFSAGGLDGTGQPTQHQFAVGARMGRALSSSTRADIAAYLGLGRFDLGTAVGAQMDAHFIGLTARLQHQSQQGLRLTAQAGVTGYRLDSATATSLAGATLAERNLLTGFVDLEIGQRIALGSGTVTPYLGLTGLLADGGDVTMALGGASTRFAPTGHGSAGLLRIGADFEFPRADDFVLRAELRMDGDGDASASIGGAFRF